MISEIDCCPKRVLSHANTRMTERHYAHLAPSYVAQTIRANFPDLGIGNLNRLVPLRRIQRALPTRSRAGPRDTSSARGRSKRSVSS